MFIDQEGKEELNSLQEEQPSFFRKNKKIIIISSIFLLIAILVLAIFYFLTNRPNPEPVIIPPAEDIPIATLPTTPELQEELLNKIFDTDIQAEIITFGDYYQKIKDQNNFVDKNYDLPINIKTGASNYYDVSRVINLDAYIDSLNNNGFAIIENPFSDNANFFSVYNYLKEKELPILLTSDFLIYYYQNTLKEVYKDIEANSFYENLWAINKKLFDISNARYKKNKQEGEINDFLLESERLEAAFFATALELLEPKDNSNIQQVGLANGLGFTIEELKKFSFELPEYLAEDVNKELSLIYQGEGFNQSPVMRYSKNYSDFTVPTPYRQNARLYNFFLTSKWLNSVFPIYEISDDCPDCLLDKDDERINFMTASLIANDFSRNQDIKNQWAIVYKVLAFFSGLRRDLNYLHYDRALIKYFGDDYDVENIFADSSKIDENISLLKDELLSINFSDIEGAFSREDEDKKNVGMRVLSDFFWPNVYILNQFIYPHIGAWNGGDEIKTNLDTTSCMGTYNRCRAIGLDVINLIYNIPKTYSYFNANSQYDNYDIQTNLFRQQLDNFNKDSWRNNNFWSTLDMMKIMLNSNNSFDPSYAQTDKWKEKELNTSLGAILNLQLDADTLNLKIAGSASNKLGQNERCNTNSIIEPDLDLVNELIANSRMLSEMLTALGVTDKLNTVSVKLNELISRLERSKEIIIKELNQEELDMNDCNFIDVFANQYQVFESAPKIKKFVFDKKGRYIIAEYLRGVKLIAVVYEINGEKIIAIGPAFNFKENKF